MNEHILLRDKAINEWLNQNNLKKCNEYQLFIAGIKPALLTPAKNSLAQKLITMSNVYSKVIMNNSRLLLSWSPLPEKIRSNSNLGLLLGYYPKACEEFNNIPLKWGLDFNGLKFNPGTDSEGAIEWCKEQYGQKLLEHYGEYYYTLTHNYKIIKLGIVRG